MAPIEISTHVPMRLQYETPKAYLALFRNSPVCPSLYIAFRLKLAELLLNSALNTSAAMYDGIKLVSTVRL